MQSSLVVTAAEYLRQYVRQLAQQLKGIRRAEDPERVHRARVATRRLRAALRVFGGELGSRKVRRWDKHIRRFAQTLGPARDHDVQTLYLSQVLADIENPDYSSGIAELLTELGHERRKLQREVCKGLRRLQRKDVVDEMRKTAKKLRKRHWGKEPVPHDAESRGAVGLHVRERLAELLAEADALRRGDDREGHHALRIAAKRLRYTMELANGAFEGQLDPTIDSVKRMQTLLGDIHDCDVWLDRIEEFLETQRAAIVLAEEADAAYDRLKVGIDFLARDRRAKRERLFEELVEFWGELERQRLWERLDVLLAAGALPTRDPSATRAGETAPAATTNQPSANGAETCPLDNAATGRAAGSARAEGAARGDGTLPKNGHTNGDHDRGLARPETAVRGS